MNSLNTFNNNNIRQLKRGPVHKKVMETRDVFVHDDNFDHREALEAAIDKKKFPLKSLFRNTYGLLVTLTLNGCLCLVYKNKIKYDPVW
jgi:hypothetical protein